MPYLVTVLIFPVFIGMFAFAAIFIFRRRRVRRLTEPPEEFILLRAPGETQRQEIERLSEKLDSCLEVWTPISISILSIPLLILSIWPSSNLVTLTVCCAALFGVATYKVVNQMARILEERANRRLGYRGERHVAEQLQNLVPEGWFIFHDVPIDHPDGKKENIDHLLAGKFGCIVVETKTRSIHKQETGRRNEVTFDGKCLHWPTFGNDEGPVKQVRRCAEWLQGWLQTHCNLDVPVFQMIAIPGWLVQPGNQYQPRVTSGRAVMSAVESILLGNKAVLTPREVERIKVKLEGLCRDVRD